MNVQCAAIIAGGASRRMGISKALISVDGQPLIAHVAATLRPVFPHLIVITSDPAIAEAANTKAAPDIYTGKGPLAGIHAALTYFEQPTFCVACDMPYLNAQFICYLGKQLQDYDAAVPRVDGYNEPLHAIYTPACLPVIITELQRERVGPFNNVYNQLRVRFIEEIEVMQFDPQLKMFENWNTPDQVQPSLAVE